MLKQFWVIICLMFSSQILWAEDSQILAFEQFIDPVAEQRYSVSVPAVAQNEQLWSVVYMVLQTNQVPDNTVLDFKVVPQGLLLKNNPAQKIQEYAFDGVQLAQKKDYVLSQFSDLSEQLEDQTGKKVQDASIFDTSRAHVYARVEDWVPDYNAQATQLNIELGKLNEMQVKGLYLILGKGEKPKDLLAIAQLDPMIKSQFHSEEMQERKAARSELREARFAIFLVIIAMGIFLGWYRFKR
ncbi:MULTISPECIES: hypothetical protein [unclassified Acinetobacter]|uniref:hypothetical protein n=1 Tax=unclassified Acinetobacter TaxID=196816 RepID=UPI0015D2A8BE|nr:MULTISPECIES: hypothetical protein [unclassified Acinetobacter]UIJ75575.1 hypothetical protein LXF01_15555 [Acinetobacter sp. SH20PTE14]